jgi:RND family efflux transporter MFP subunit
MTQVRPDVDLSQLRRAQAGGPPPPRRWLRIVVPLAIVVVFGGIIASSLGDLVGRAREITVVRPKPATGEFAAASGSVALQAAGWVEPDPFPILVPALASGVLSELLVQESDAVKKGDPVARMIDDEARIALDRADAALDQARAEHARAAAESAIADEIFETALAVNENAAATKALAAGKAAGSRLRAHAVAGGESELRVAEENLVVEQRLAEQGAAGPRAVELAEARVRSARAALEVLRADAEIATKEAEAEAARATRAQRELELRLDDRLRRDTARALLDLAVARVRSAEAERRDAALRLERMTIRAPADGIVMERLAAPGKPLKADDPAGAVVCSLFDPAHVRIRVDIAQSDVAKAAVGQEAEILSQARSGRPYRGEAIRIVQKADIQKVTLQVHVRVLDGDGLLRPEMLCQVRFLSKPRPESLPADGSGAAVMIPARLVVDDRFVWTVDPESPRARRRTIEIEGRSGEWAVVRSGLNVTDKLIDEGRAGIEEGARLRIREE